MTISITFPNFLCLLLTVILIVNMFARDPTMGGRPDLPDNLESLYCKLPQSYKVEDSRRCTSTQRLFFLLGNGCSLGRKPRRGQEFLTSQNETELEEPKDSLEEVVTVEVADEPDSEWYPEKEAGEDVTTSIVDSFVISLLVCSVIISLLELYREKTGTQEQGGGEGTLGLTGGGDVGADRRMSLADLTVNRHIRRGDSELTRQNCVASGSKPPPLLRRSSFPAQFPEARVRQAPQRQQSTPGMPSMRRLSVDLDDDASPDRRRVRIIRRH